MTSDPVPGGCTMTTVGASCEVHLMLRGLVDVAKEISRLEEKIDKLDTQISKLKKTMSMENYEQKVIICDFNRSSVFSWVTFVLN